MKKQIALLATVAVAAAATMAFAQGSIVGTAHDLSGTYKKADGTTLAGLGADEICIYCHTPHNPTQAIPLWNRNNPSNTLFTLYKTSPTLTSATQAAAFSINSVSVFCMSCHDGVTALGNIKNAMSHSMDSTTVISNQNGQAGLTVDPLAPGGGDRLGRDLTNSHPVGFNYVNAQTADPTLHLKATAAASLGTTNGGSQPFFSDGANQTGDMMECASCHKVHDNEYGKFLRKSNANSALCLACHKK